LGTGQLDVDHSIVDLLLIKELDGILGIGGGLEIDKAVAERARSAGDDVGFLDRTGGTEVLLEGFGPRLERQISNKYSGRHNYLREEVVISTLGFDWEDSSGERDQGRARIARGRTGEEERRGVKGTVLCSLQPTFPPTTCQLRTFDGVKITDYFLFFPNRFSGRDSLNPKRVVPNMFLLRHTKGPLGFSRSPLSNRLIPIGASNRSTEGGKRHKWSERPTLNPIPLPNDEKPVRRVVGM